MDSTSNVDAKKRILEEDTASSSPSKLPRTADATRKFYESDPRSDENDTLVGEKMDGKDALVGGKESQKRRGKGRKGRVESLREPQFDDDGNPIPKAIRYPKRMCALLLGFCGSGYSGMQMYCNRV